VIALEMHDPIYRFATWYHLSSPYGPLFTAASYPVAWLPLGLAYWTLKLAAVLGSLAFIALVWKCARLLGRDPRFAVMFVAANPVYLMYAIGGFHNDFFMLIPSTAAVALLLARRDRSAGAALVVAVAVKFTAILLLPFLLVAARPAQRRSRVLVGACLAAIPLAVFDLALFGLSLPNLADQSTLLTPFSVPNVVGMILGVGGGTPGLLRLANVALVVAVALLLRRRGEWLTGAGWSTLALIVSLAWLVPWYVIWLLPLAALASSIPLRRAALWATLYVAFAFVPTTGMLFSAIGIDLMGGSAGHASRALQKKLER
jgi:alpha-1,6-mannosyltransferase